MKIKEIRAVNVHIPHTPPKTKPRRPTWNRSAPQRLTYQQISRVFPIAKPNARYGWRTGVGADHR